MEQQRQLECTQTPAVYGEGLPPSWLCQQPQHRHSADMTNVLQDIGEDGSKAAFGSEGAELSIWDIVTQQRSYIAKGSKPNRIGLVDHPNNTAVAFIPGTDATKVRLLALCVYISFRQNPSVHIDTMHRFEDILTVPLYPTQVLTGTAKHKLLLYDVKHGRRPVLDISFGEARICALAAEGCGKDRYGIAWWHAVSSLHACSHSGDCCCRACYTARHG